VLLWRAVCYEAVATLDEGLATVSTSLLSEHPTRLLSTGTSPTPHGCSSCLPIDDGTVIPTCGDLGAKGVGLDLANRIASVTLEYDHRDAVASAFQTALTVPAQSSTACIDSRGPAVGTLPYRVEITRARILRKDLGSAAETTVAR